MTDDGRPQEGGWAEAWKKDSAAASSWSAPDSTEVPAVPAAVAPSAADSAYQRDAASNASDQRGQDTVSYQGAQGYQSGQAYQGAQDYQAYQGGQSYQGTQAYQQNYQYAGAQGQQAAASSAWWVPNATSDPWRDPGSSPAWVQQTTPLPSMGSGVEQPPTAERPGGRRSMWPVVLVAAVTAVLVGPLGGAVGYVAAVNSSGGEGGFLGGNGATPAAANRAPQSVAAIVKRVAPGSVAIETQGNGQKGNGSGFAIRKDGYIVTNNHVAEPAANGGSLQVVFHDNSRAPATIVGRDPVSDLAVLKVNRTNLTPLELGDSDQLAVGDPVIAFGAPLNLASTVTTGIVSALDRPVVTGQSDSDLPGAPKKEPVYTAAIQTDAAINPGNSGGPLVDAAGRVIGVDSSIAQIPGSGPKGSIGLGFAIPGNLMKRIAQQIITTGKAKRTVLGAELDPQEIATGGVRIRTVPAGPAQQAGLRVGDVITKFNGKVIGDSVELIALIRKLPGGTAVSLDYTRGAQSAKATVRLTETS